MLLLCILLLSPSCVTALRPDPSPPAVDANFPTAEFWAQDRLFHGLGEVSLTRGQPLSAAALKVQGYYKGVIRVDSDGCKIAQSWNYVKHELKTVELHGVAETSCLVDIIVMPTYPGEDGGGERVFEYKGQLFIKVLDDNKDWYGAHTAVKAGNDAGLAIPMGAEVGPNRVVFRGCDINFDRFYPVEKGVINVKLSELGKSVAQRRCVVEGFVQLGNGNVKRVSWHVWTYGIEFAPLPLPSIEVDGDHIVVSSDPPVSAISMDDEYQPGPEAKFRFDDKITHVLRLLTTKGRSTVCQYFPSRGWGCQN